MPPTRFFLDTGYVIALLNPRDLHHQKAKALYPQVRNALEVWTTEAVLIEIGNGLSINRRKEATAFISQCYSTPNIFVANVSTELLRKAVELYSSRHDKTWGLTDCVSFIVMLEHNLTDALTPDSHFEQAGFRALLR